MRTGSVNSQSGVTFTKVSFTPPARPGSPVQSETRPILNGISVDLPTGSVTALLGRSGSGKTTLLRTVNGLVLPTAGSINVNDITVAADTSTAALRKLRQGIGYVIQETGLFPHLTILRNVGMPLALASVPKNEREERAARILQQVGLDPTQFAERRPHELSGGQRQRVGLARALVNDPAVLLLDEPFGALDPLTRAEMQTMLRDLLQDLKKTALIVTHDLQEGIFLAERILFIDSGGIAANIRISDGLHSKLPVVSEYVTAATRFESAA